MSIDYSMYFSLYPTIHADCGDLLIQNVTMFVYIDVRRIVSGLLQADVAEN
jgi:hypothetical protein